jgi:hypothetical protein
MTASRLMTGRNMGPVRRLRLQLAARQPEPVMQITNTPDFLYPLRASHKIPIQAKHLAAALTIFRPVSHGLKNSRANMAIN